jgi:hypothetical protein
VNRPGSVAVTAQLVGSGLRLNEWTGVDKETVMNQQAMRQAETLEQRLDVRLARIEAHLAGLDARLQTWSTVSVDDAVCSGRDISSGWTESTSMTWWSESAGGANGQRLLTARD